MAPARRGGPGSRSGERGATVFIVVLVLVMLTAIGVFAASAASLATTASGHQRQTAQTRYLTEYAISLVLADIEKEGGMSKLTRAQQQSKLAGAPPLCSTDTKFCFSYLPSTLENQTNQAILVPSIVGVPGLPGIPGSLGVADVDWKFKVELTDMVPAIIPPAGANLTTISAVKVQYWMVAVNARGVIWPNGTGAENAMIASVGSQDVMTAYITTP